MSDSILIQQIAEKVIDKKEIAQKVMEKPGLLSEIYQGLFAEKANIKYGCAKVLRIIAEKQPGLLYPKFDFFVELLDHENNIFKWEAIFVLSHLTAVDEEKKFEPLFEKYFQPISGSVLITAANVIGGAAKIALAKPHLVDKITSELLKVENARYQTPECRNIALGHAIKSFNVFYEHINDKEPVNNLIKNQLDNKRNSTKKAAEKFVKKWGLMAN